MAQQYTNQDLSGSEFKRVNLSHSRIVRCDLSNLWIRGGFMAGAVIEPTFWYEESIVVCGIDIVPLIDAELDRLHPGRSLRRSEDPDGLRAAWAALESTWAATLERVAAMPAGTVDVSLEDEWTFAQTLRHLVMATDSWLRKTILAIPDADAFHPIGQPDAGYAAGGFDTSLFTTDTPTFDEVLAVRAERQRMVREYLAGVTAEQLTEQHPFPWDPEGKAMESTLNCLHVIMAEEWEHHRYAVRDLDAIAAAATPSRRGRE